MPLLSDSDKVYLGGTALDAVYLGGAKVWPSRPPAQPPYLSTEEDGLLLVWHMPYDRLEDIPTDWTEFEFDAPDDLAMQILMSVSGEYLVGQTTDGFDPNLPSRVRLHAADGPWVNVFSGDGTTRLVWGEVGNALFELATDPFVYRRVGDHVVMDSLSRTTVP